MYKLYCQKLKTLSFKTGILPAVRLVAPLSATQRAIMAGVDGDAGYPGSIVALASAERARNKVYHEYGNRAFITGATRFFSNYSGVALAWEKPYEMIRSISLLNGLSSGMTQKEINILSAVETWKLGERMTYVYTLTSAERTAGSTGTTSSINELRDFVAQNATAKLIAAWTRTFPDMTVMVGKTFIGANPAFPSRATADLARTEIDSYVEGIAGNQLTFKVYLPVSAVNTWNGTSQGTCVLVIRVNLAKVPGLESLKFTNNPATNTNTAGSEVFEPNMWYKVDGSVALTVKVHQWMFDHFARLVTTFNNATVTAQAAGTELNLPVLDVKVGYPFNAPAWCDGVDFGPIESGAGTTDVVLKGETLSYMMPGSVLKLFTQGADDPAGAGTFQGTDFLYQTYAVERKSDNDPLSTTDTWKDTAEEDRAEILNSDFVEADIAKGTPAIKLKKANENASNVSYRDAVFALPKTPITAEPTVSVTVAAGLGTYSGGDEVDWLATYLAGEDLGYTSTDPTYASKEKWAQRLAGKPVVFGEKKRQDGTPTDELMRTRDDFSPTSLGQDKYAWLTIQQFGVSREQLKAAVRASVAQALVQSETVKVYYT